MKTTSLFRSLFIAASISLVLVPQTGCMTVQRGSPVVQNADTQRYKGRKIAILPAKTQASLATDSILPLRQEVNKQLGRVAKAKLPGSTVLDVATVAEELNQKNLLPAYEQLVATYENTGVMDRKQVKALARGLNSDYLLFTRLKAEKMDLLISRGMGSSLDVMLVEADSGEVTWSGASEFKRGGIFGAGDTPPAQAADKLLELAFKSL